MSILGFVQGKQYRFLKDGDGDLYCGCDVQAGQEFVADYVYSDNVQSEGVTYRGKTGVWCVYLEGDDLSNFELVDPPEVDIISDVIIDKEILLHLKDIQSIISEAAEVGFNPSAGDWANKMFNTNRTTSDILRERTGCYAGSTLESEND